jgi:nucleoside-diphosphate-sugar epimerase
VAVVPIFATHARDDKKLRINGDGTQSRDFTFVDNVVHANLLALETTAAAAFGEVFNVGLGSNTSVNDIAKAVLSLANKDPAQMITHVSPRAGDIQRSQADISKLKKVLGFTPQTTFEVGLKMTVEHYLNKQ